MELELQLLEGKFAKEIQKLLTNDVFHHKRKVKKATKLCFKILEGEIISEDKLVKSLHHIEHMLLDESKQSLKLLQIILLIGKEDYNSLLNVLDYFTDEHDKGIYSSQLDYSKAFIKIFELHNFESVKEDMKFILNYLNGNSPLGTPFWKLAYLNEDIVALKEILDYAKTLQPNDVSLIEFNVWLLQKEEKHKEVLEFIDNLYKNKDKSEFDDDFNLNIQMSQCHSLFELGDFTKLIKLLDDIQKALPDTIDSALNKSEVLILRQQALNSLAKTDEFDLSKWEGIIKEDTEFLKTLLPNDDRVKEIIENSPVQV